ncbi:MAG: putative DNA-binding domain-containing protein [Planctomycetes bacterium]|nr:putative DNA-binding domain-containing protein [Planctomycetota bacterium]
MSTPSPSPSLKTIQQWMQAVITHPDGVETGIRSPEAKAQIDLSNGRLEDVVSPSAALTSHERMHIYANAYYARLLECLEDEFPAVVHAMGEEAFGGMAFGYLQQFPSMSYTLSDLGAKFPHYLQETRPPRENGDEPDWADFLIELARLQRIYSEVFDGPGIERTELLQVEDLTSIPVENWGRVRFRTAPCLRLESFQFPVHDYASAVRNEEDAVFTQPAATYLIISRLKYRVRRWACSRQQHDLLKSLDAGKTLNEAIADTLAADDGDLDAVAANLRDWFEEWSVNGLFVEVQWDGDADSRS